LPGLDILRDKLFMALTMALGSFIAGATSEGGGAVAFPVMTLIFKIAPSTARDFSLLIQSCGMTAASFAILKNKIKVNKEIILFTSFGSIFGNILGFLTVVPSASPIFIKIFFCSLWLSFIIILFLGKIKKKKLSYF